MGAMSHITSIPLTHNLVGEKTPARPGGSCAASAQENHTNSEHESVQKNGQPKVRWNQGSDGTRAL
jgi:hypothetical protein